MSKTQKLIDRLTEDELERLAQIARIADWWYRGGKALAWLKYFIPLIVFLAAWFTGVIEGIGALWDALMSRDGG